jgi:hypothetical protein
MAASEAAICNLALLRVGVLEPIDSLEEPTAEARACKMVYAPARDRLLAEAAWPFAVMRADLVAIADGARGDFAYAYSLPTGCLWPIRLADGSAWKLEHDATAAVLLSDAESPELVYIGRVTDTARFSPAFDDALAWLVAAEIAMPLTTDQRLELRAREGYGRAMLDAPRNETVARQPFAGDTLTAMSGGSW